MKKILFVCLGNICRSPIAEGIARARFAEADLDVEVASAGLGDWHVGNPPDRRAIAAAWHSGVDISGQRAAQVDPAALPEYAMILGMDQDNIDGLIDIVGAGNAGQIHLLTDFCDGPETEVPDPYFGGHQGFEEVVGLVEKAVRGLVAHLS